MQFDIKKVPSRDELLVLVEAMSLKKKILIIAATVLVIVAGFYYFSIADEQTSIKSNRVTLASLEKDRLEKQAIADNLPKFRRDIEKLNKDLKEALTMMPNEAEVPELLQKVSEMVEMSGLQLDVFELMGEQPQGFYSKVPMSMEVSGSFHEVVVFLDKLSKLPRIINVTDINMSDSKFKNQKMTLKGSLLATTFRFIEGELPTKKSEEEK